MALQLKKRNFKLSTAATGALVLGAGFIIIKTFPHLKLTISTCLFGTKKGDGADDDNKPIEVIDRENAHDDDTLSYPASAESMVEIQEWSDENLKSFLLEVRLH